MIKYGIWWTNKSSGISSWASYYYFNTSYNKYMANEDSERNAFLEDINEAYGARSALEKYYTSHWWEVREFKQ